MKPETVNEVPSVGTAEAQPGSGAAIGSVEWPDIGKDPLKYRDEVLGGVEGADQRLSLASAVQQKGVPDQTALVWRIDIDRLRCELIVMTARWNSRQRIKAPPNDKLSDGAEKGTKCTKE